MNQPRDHLLAGAGLAANQHARVGVRDLVDAIEHQPHGGVIADDGDAGGVAARRAPRRGAGDRVFQRRGVKRLGDDGGGPRAQRLDGARDRAVRGQRQRRDRGTAGARLHDHAGAFARGQAEIDDHQRELRLAEPRDRAGGGRARGRLEAHRARHPDHHGGDRGFVADDENRFSHFP